MSGKDSRICIYKELSKLAYICRLSDSLNRNIGIILDGDSKEALIISGKVLAGRIS